MKKQRKHYTPEEKVAILRRHLVEGVPISDLCDEWGLQPTVFYRWQKEFFENGAAAFQQRGRVTDETGLLPVCGFVLADNPGAVLKGPFGKRGCPGLPPIPLSSRT
jgi:transposase